MPSWPRAAAGRRAPPPRAPDGAGERADESGRRVAETARRARARLALDERAEPGEQAPALVRVERGLERRECGGALVVQRGSDRAERLPQIGLEPGRERLQRRVED